MKPITLISRSQEEIEAIYKPFTEAQQQVMGHGALAIWALVCPERFGHSLRPIMGRHQKAINLLRDMFHSLPNRGKHIKLGRRTLAANLLLRDLA